LSPRRIAFLLLIVSALMLGGWLVVKPVMATRMPTVVVPPIDVESPAGRARPQAPPALAKSASGTSVLAVDAATSATVSRIGDDKVRCGEDQLPEYKTPDPDADGAIHLQPPVPDPDGVVRHFPGEIKAAGVGYTGAMRRIDAELRSSPDPFDRAMADWLDLDTIYTPSARLDALAQDASGVSDPRTYALAYETCHAMDGVAPVGELAPLASPGCGRLNAADWAQLDPGNGVPWLYALARATRSGDHTARREAIDHLAASSRFDTHPYAGAAAVARLKLPGDADLTAQLLAAMKAAPISMPPFQSLTSSCHDRAGGDASLATTCGQIAGMLFDHSDELVARGIGAAIHKQLTGDPTWLDRAHRDVLVSTQQFAASAVDASPCGGARDGLKRFVRLDTIGEMVLIKQAGHAASTP